MAEALPVFECRRCRYDLTGLKPDMPCPECGEVNEAAGVRFGKIADDRPCLSCGYNIKGLEAEGKCPECGVAVARSLQGNLLRYSSVAHVKRLQLGMQLVVFGIFVFTMYVIAMISVRKFVGPMSSGALTDVLISLMPIASTGLGLAGWWLVSSPDPALLGVDSSLRVRRVLRVAVVVSAACFVCSTLAQLMGVQVSVLRASTGKGAKLAFAVVLIANMAWIVQTIASLKYLDRLSVRIPSRGLQRRAASLLRMIWIALVIILLLAALVVLAEAAHSTDLIPCLGMCVVTILAIGFIIWCCAYVSLIGAFSRVLGEIAKGRLPRLPD